MGDDGNLTAVFLPQILVVLGQIHTQHVVFSWADAPEKMSVKMSEQFFAVLFD